MSDPRKQDMPPEGGYIPINIKRVPARTLFSGKTWITGYFVMTTLAALVYHYTRKQVLREEIEIRSSYFALYPMLLAERDREYLKQLRKNRDEEAALMEGVDDWEVGTFYGERLRKLDPEDKLHEPTYQEFYVHCHAKHFAKRADLQLMS